MAEVRHTTAPAASLDFGTGAHSQFTFSIAPHGTIVFASKIG